MALQGSGSSRDAPQTIRMVARTPTQQGTMSSNHILAGYSTIDNAQIQPAVSLAMVPGLVPATQTIASSQGHNVAPAAVTATSGSTVGMQSLGHVILRSPKEELGQREQERRIRREIANSNERRRMQSINAGFKSLKSILPHTDGEKLSKAAILQQTSEYITQLESDKLKLMNQNEKLRRAFTDCKCNSSKHRALADIFEKDEGIGSPAEEDFEDVRRGLIEVRQLLDKERRLRIMYEEQVRTLESQIYPERVQSMKVSSSDERRSSSECSPSVVKPAVAMPSSKIQTCARPLLPPLAPLFSKGEKSDGGSPSSANTTPAASVQAQTSDNAVHNIPAIKEESSEPKLVPSSLSTQSEHLVTVFSHSSKSNQPLKKRAIEIHHQSLSDAGNDSGTQPPKKKIAKISIDQPPDIGTRYFLPPTLPPIPTAPSNPPLFVHSLPSAAQSSKVQPKLSVLSTDEITQSNAPCTALPSIQFPVLNSKDQPMFISPTTAPQQFSHVVGPQYISVHPPVTLPNPPKVMMPAGSSNPVTRVEVFPSSQPVDEDVVTLTRRTSQDGSLDNSAAAGISSPVYLTVNGLPNQGANVAYIQHEGNKIIQLAHSYHQPHLIMAPVSNSGAVVVTPQTPDQLLTAPLKDTRPQVLTQQTIFQHGNTGAKIHPAVIAFQTNVSSGISVAAAPGVQSSSPKAALTEVSNVRPPVSQAFLPASAFPPKFQPKIQSPHTLLCYTQPEITLNQLNAVPNLALPKSLHQPGAIPVSASILQPPTGADSPSYMSSSLQDTAMQTKPSVYINPSALRCRKSSLSATDSCSTASVSGAEDEEGPPRNPLTDDPDNQSAESVPTIKLSDANSSAAAENSAKSPTRSMTVAACDDLRPEIHEKAQATHGVDVADCGTPPPSDSVPVLPNVTGSPPVIRRIDAIQTRRNLEAIVQAIDHLEQQERRNSQDRSEASDDSSH